MFCKIEKKNFFKAYNNKNDFDISFVLKLRVELFSLYNVGYLI